MLMNMLTIPREVQFPRLLSVMWIEPILNQLGPFLIHQGPQVESVPPSTASYCLLWVFWNTLIPCFYWRGSREKVKLSTQTLKATVHVQIYGTTKELGILRRVTQSLCSSTRKWGVGRMTGCLCRWNETVWPTVLYMLAIIIISILEIPEPWHSERECLVKKSRASKGHLSLGSASVSPCLLASFLQAYMVVPHSGADPRSVTALSHSCSPVEQSQPVTLRCLQILSLQINILSKELVECTLLNWHWSAGATKVSAAFFPNTK